MQKSKFHFQRVVFCYRLNYMDLDKQFKDLNLDEKVEVAKEATEKVVEKVAEKNEALEKVDDFSESDKILADLQSRLSNIDNDEDTEVVPVVVTETFFDKFKSFLIPILLTVFALILTLALLYFFSKNRVKESDNSITNTGPVEEVIYPKKEVIVVTEPEPELEPEVVATTTPVLFEEGTTTIVNVRFSYDKINYDTYPRGIYLNEQQIFEGDYMDYKLSASNRPYANDFFFGRDRYMVSLIGDCSYVVDEANILVGNMKEGNKLFTGKVLKIIDSSKPHIVCAAGQSINNNYDANQ